MDSSHDNKSMNVEGDRLSSLPDDLILKILSYIGLRCAIKTSTLLSRWRFIWTSILYLDFSSEDFVTLPKFSNFVTHVLSRRNNLVEVFSVKLRFNGDYSQEFFKQLMNYAFSHNIQKLDVECLLENDTEFPLDLFNSQSLKHLSLQRVYVYKYRNRYLLSRVLTTTSTWELPSLTTLYLGCLTLGSDDSPDKSIGHFSKCVNLKNLTLMSCKPKGVNSLSICLPQLSNLTLANLSPNWKEFNVVTPQLKNLTIKNYLWEQYYLISAPKLASLIHEGCHLLYLSTDGFPSLEKVDFCVSSQKDVDAYGIVCLFKEFQSVKYLKLNLDMVELLSSNVELISDHPSPFTNLETLKISPRWLISEEEEQKKVMSTEVKSYLLDSSPSAIFTLVSREEIRVRKTKWAQKLMTKLRVLLEHEQAKLGERMTHINSCWIDLSVQIAQGKSKTSDIISQLQDIKKLLINWVPASKRAELCVSNFCVSNF